jgi:hypothetical protein
VVCAPDALVALSINSVRLQHIMHTDSNSSSTAAQWKGRTVARYTTVLEDGAEVAPRGLPGTQCWAAGQNFPSDPDQLLAQSPGNTAATSTPDAQHATDIAAVRC